MWLSKESGYIRLSVWGMKRCRATWEAGGMERGSESGGDGRVISRPLTTHWRHEWSAQDLSQCGFVCVFTVIIEG